MILGVIEFQDRFHLKLVGHVNGNSQSVFERVSDCCEVVYGSTETEPITVPVAALIRVEIDTWQIHHS
jgi:hypothetical protein